MIVAIKQIDERISGVEDITLHTFTQQGYKTTLVLHCHRMMTEENRKQLDGESLVIITLTTLSTSEWHSYIQKEGIKERGE